MEMRGPRLGPTADRPGPYWKAKKGYGYERSDLQDIGLHKLWHKHEGY
jgi:hypothetical protein